MAPTKSNKRKRKTTKKSRVQKQLRSRCVGHYKDQSRCHRTVSHTREQTAVYCSSHAYQASSADDVARIRYCDGLTQTYEQCSARVALSLPRDRPALCAAHKAQEHLHKSVQCFGVGDDGQRCTQQIPWKSPFCKFCTSHEDQETSFGCPITLLPDDAAALIFDLLQPYERVAFALSNKSCAAVIKNWSRGREMSLPKPQMLVYRQHEAGYLASRLSTPNKHGTTKYPNKLVSKVVLPARLCSSHDPCGVCAGRKMLGSDGNDWSWTHPNPFSIHDSASSKDGMPLLRMMRAHPYLFGPGLKRCACCSNQLTAKDSKYWTRQPAYKKQAIAHRHEMGEVPANDNPETIFCKSCDTAGAKIELEWCYGCRGEITVTAMARAYWSAQKEASEADKAFELALIQDTTTSYSVQVHAKGGKPRVHMDR